MACCTLNVLPVVGNRYSSFVPSSLVVNRKPPLNEEIYEEIYPQSLNSLKYPLVCVLVLAQGAEPPAISEIRDGLQACWNPDATWRLVSIRDGYFTLQFSSMRDHIKISGMASTQLRSGTMKVLSKLDLLFKAFKDLTAPPSITSVRWVPPRPSWVKVNTDGSAHGCPGQSSCGGVFRDCQGMVVRCFSQKLGLGFAVEAELHACVLALDIAHARGWNKVWLESDSTDVVEMLATRSSVVPEKLKSSWKRAMVYLEGMEFRVTHIYREGNRVADALAALAHWDTENGWWPHAIPAISELARQDAAGCFNTRIRA